MILLGNMASFISTKSAMTTLIGARTNAVELPGGGGPGLNSDNTGNTSLTTGTAHFSRKLDIHLKIKILACLSEEI